MSASSTSPAPCPANELPPTPGTAVRPRRPTRESSRPQTHRGSEIDAEGLWTRRRSRRTTLGSVETLDRFCRDRASCERWRLWRQSCGGYESPSGRWRGGRHHWVTCRQPTQDRNRGNPPGSRITWPPPPSSSSRPRRRASSSNPGSQRDSWA